MKRFFAALILLAVTVFTAVYLNSKTLSLAEEFIEIIDSDCTAAQLRNAWEEKSKLFTILLPHEQVEDIETIIESLVDQKDQVQITRVDDEKGVLLKVKVADEDMGKVIGKQGRIAKAIRTVMKAVTSKEHKRVGIVFEE